MKRLFIVDAMALIYRSFYAFGRSLTNSEGLPTSAIFGTAMFMNKLIREENPDYLMVVTDTKDPTFRHEMYKEYKAHRDAMPDELVEQLPFIYDLFKAYGAEAIKRPGFEADDVIGSFAEKHAAEDLDVYIVSGDKDFLQLVNDHVFLYTSKKNEPANKIGIEGVFERFKCRPDQVIDILALMGDKSDNVPGVHGIGEKGATKLVSEFGNLDGIYAHLEDIGGKKQKERLIEHKEDAYMSRELVTIKTDIELDYSLEDFLCTEASAINEDLLYLFSKLEFKQLAKKVADSLNTPSDSTQLSGEQQVKDAQEPTTSIKPNDERKPSTYVDVGTLTKTILNEIKDSKVLSIAVETDVLDYVSDPAERIGVFTPSGQGWSIPLTIINIKALSSVFSDPSVLVIGHGVKRFYQLLKNAGLIISSRVMDTKICDYLLHPNSNQHDFESVAQKRITGWAGESSAEADSLPLPRIAEGSYLLYQELMPLIKAEGMERLLEDIEIPLLPVLADMEQRGVYLDAEFLAEYSIELGEKLDKLTGGIYELAGEEFNINSPKQLQVILFEKLKVHERLGVKRIKKTKSGFSTDESVLSQLAEDPLIKLILDYRQITKLKGTYVDALPGHVKQKTGRLHTTFHQTVAATGRLSSDNPNLQNIPMRSEMGRKIRKAFRAADKDSVLVSADYSQVEIRLLAHLADAKELIDAFKDGLDIHRVTAAKIFGVAEEAVDSTLRSRAKAINFGIIYGMGPQRLSRETGVTVNEAKEFIERYFEVYPEIKYYTDRLMQDAKELGYSTTLTGRRRPIIGINDANRGIAVRAENMAVNSPIQGGAADIIKKAMIQIQMKINTNEIPAEMLLQIHDELVFSCKEKDVEGVMKQIKQAMESVVETKVPLLVDVNYGKDWLEAH